MHEDKAIMLAEALESGEYQQAPFALYRLRADESRPAGQCCLGVACEVAIKGGLHLEFSDEGALRSYEGHEAYLPPAVQDYFGFGDRSGDFGAGPGLRGYAALYEANDAGVTFAEIAAYIRKNFATL